jgi:hypothetical protein
MAGDIRQALEAQARAADDLGSPFSARLCRLLAARLRPGGAVADRVFGWPGDVSGLGDNVPLRLTGALHALVLSRRDPGLAAAFPPDPAEDGALWAAVDAALARHAAFVDRFLDSPPQTNEVARSAGLIAVGHLLAAHLGRPLVLSELGASAGLNLNWDRYALSADGAAWGPSDAPVVLAPEWRGARPPLATPEVVERRGVDLRPFDLTDPEQVLRLMAYVWPDQPARLERLRRAVALPQPPLDRGDAAAWLERRLAEPRPGALHLVYNTIAWQYFPPDTQAACARALAQAGGRATPAAPLAHFRMENDGTPPGAVMEVTLWPGGATHRLGRIDFHGRWLDWTLPRLP